MSINEVKLFLKTCQPLKRTTYVSTILLTIAALTLLPLQQAAQALVPVSGTSPSLLTSNLGAIGDSVSTAFSATSYGSKPTLSWSTGTSTEVLSIKQRIEAAKGSAITTSNKAVPGSTSSKLLDQANSVVSAGADATTFLMGANDICTAGTVGSMTSVATYQARVHQALQILNNANVKTLVGSVQNIHQLWQVGKDDAATVTTWDEDNTCQVMLNNPNSTAQADNDRRAAVLSRLQEYNAVLQSECAALQNCVFDNGALSNTAFTLADISALDAFHPNVTGQNKIAETLWPFYKQIFPGVFDPTTEEPTDTTAPTISITSPTDYETVSGLVNIAAAASDDVAVTSVKIFEGSTELGNATLSGSVWSLPYDTTAVSNGLHTITAKGYDAAGNVGTSQQITFTVINVVIDTQAPEVTVTSPLANSTVSGTINLSATATDSSGIASVTFSKDSTVLGAATYNGMAWEMPLDTTLLAEGAHSVTATAYDLAGNIGVSQAVIFTVQNQVVHVNVPAVSLVSPANGATVSGAITFTATASDVEGVVRVKFFDGTTHLGNGTVSGSTWSLPYASKSLSNGNHTITAKAYDAHGNVTTSAARSLVVNNPATDTIAPTVNIISPAANATVKGIVLLEASATDNVGVTSLRYYSGTTLLGNATLVNGTWRLSYNTASLANGTYKITAKAYDAAGKVGTSAARSFKLNKTAADALAPMIDITSPKNSTIVAGSVVLESTASDNIGVTSVQYFVDGVSVGNATLVNGKWTKTINSISMSEGIHTIYAKAFDAVGNAKTTPTQNFIVGNNCVEPTTTGIPAFIPCTQG